MDESVRRRKTWAGLPREVPEVPAGGPSRRNGTRSVEVRLMDDKNVQCLDARNWFYFSLAGDGELIGDLGTSSGSRKVQAYNGRAIIRVKSVIGASVLCIKSPGIETVFLNLNQDDETP